MNQFINLTSKGLNTLEIDVKDENGEVGYTAGAPALASKIGATRNYYDARQLITEAHAAGHLRDRAHRLLRGSDPLQQRCRARDPHDLGRRLEERGRPRLDERVRPVRLELPDDRSKAAAKMGFDEIQYDYVRFPTDGDIADAVWPHKVAEPLRDDDLPLPQEGARRRSSRSA